MTRAGVDVDAQRRGGAFLRSPLIAVLTVLGVLFGALLGYLAVLRDDPRGAGLVLAALGLLIGILGGLAWRTNRAVQIDRMRDGDGVLLARTCLALVGAAMLTLVVALVALTGSDDLSVLLGLPLAACGALLAALAAWTRRDVLAGRW